MNRVLIVDSEPNLRLLYRLELQCEGYTVAGVGTAMGALQILKHTKFEAIVIELRLPDLSGLKLLSLIQAQYPGTPVVINTTGERSRYENRIAAQGFVTKSSDLTALKAALAAVVAKHNKQRRRHDVPRWPAGAAGESMQLR